MFQSVLEVFFTRFAPVIVRSYPGVNDQLAYGVAVKDVHEIVELIWIIVAEPGLDRYLNTFRFSI